MEKFEINILGCGSALPTVRHFGSAQVVNIREKLYMVDCAEASQLLLRRSKLKMTKINHIFISHLHGDHYFGLIGLISTLGLQGRTATLNIYGHKDLETVMRPQIDYFCRGLEYEIIFNSIDTKTFAPIFEDKSVTVYSIPLKHRIPCCGFLFREKPGLRHIKRDVIDAYNIPISQINNIKAGLDYVCPDGEVIPNSIMTTPSDPARSYAYCADTKYMPELAEMVKGIDLLYHEATFADDNQSRAAETFHSTASQAAKTALDAGVKKLVIGHFSSRYEDESILLDEAKKIFPETILAKENLKLTL